MDDFDRIKICPICKKETTWGSMIWLEGLCTCPGCYKIHRAELDKVLEAQRKMQDTF